MPLLPRVAALVASAALAWGLLVGGSAQSAMVTPDVVNGRPPAAGEFTFLAAIRAYTSSTSYDHCGGSFVSPTQVVTAAHCLYDDDDDVTTRVEVAPAVGTAMPASTAFVRASRVDIHRGFSPDTETDDIALVTLASPVAGVTPVRLPTAAEGRALTMAGAAVTSAGWGATSSGGWLVRDFLVADLRVVPEAVCSSPGATYVIGTLTFVGIGPDVDGRTMICAGGTTPGGLPVDTCQGDSGGPLVAGTGAGARLVGLVSWGIGCAGMDDDEPIPLTPGVYTRIAAYLPWLAEHGVLIEGVATTPGQVRGLTRGSFTRNSSGYRVTVRWKPPTRTGGAMITGYVVRVKASGTWLRWQAITGTSVRITGMARDTRHAVQVRAVNEAGPGPRAALTFRTPRR